MKREMNMNSRVLFIALTGCLLAAVTSFGQSTSWKGTSSNAWATSTNWTNGVPTASLDAVIGDASFTGSNQPSISGAAAAKSLTIGSGAKASTLTVTRQFTVSNGITIGSNGTIAHTSTSTSFYISVGGDFANNGAYSTVNSNATIIMAGSSQSISGSSTSTFQCLTINSGSTTALSVNIVIGNVLTVSGIFDLSSYTANRSTSGGTLSVSNGSTLKIGGTNTFPSNYSSHSLGSTSTIEYSGTNQTVTSETYGNLTLSSGSGTSVKTMPGSSLTISGNLTSSVGGGTSLSFTAASAINLTGNLTIGASTTFNAASYSHSIQGDFTNNGTFNCNTSTITLSGSSKTLAGASTFNNLTLSGNYAAVNDIIVNGTMYLSGTYNAASTTVTLNGSLTLNGTLTSSGIITFSGTGAQSLQINSGLSSTGTVNFNGSVSPTINSQTVATFFNVNINNTGGVVAASNWVVNGDCSIASGATLDGGGSVLTFYGNFTNGGTLTSINSINYLPASAATISLSGTDFISQGVLNLGGSGAITIIDSPAFIQDVNILNANSSGITFPTSWNIEGNLYVDNSSILNLGSQLHHVVAGTLTNNGMINQASGSISIGGDLVNNSTISSDTGTFVFNGPVNQNVTTNASVFYNVAINNTGGITQNDDLTLSNVLSLNNGLIYGSSYHTIITNTSDTSLKNYSASSYVDGTLRRSILNNTLTYSFPVGDGTHYTLAEVINNNMTGINYIDGSFGPKLGNDVGLNVSESNTIYNFINNTGVWYITPDAPLSSGTYDLKCYINAFPGLSDNEFGILSRPDSSSNAADWNTDGGLLSEDGGLGRNVSDGYSVRHGLTGFSQKGIAGSGFLLPITLSSFEVNKQGANALLNWKTSSESNSNYYDIERAGGDSLSFKKIGMVKACGTSVALNSYRFTDSTINEPGTLYYRIKLVNMDNTYSYSNIKYLQFNGPLFNISQVFPNPANDYAGFEVTTEQKTIVTLRLINSVGQIILNKNAAVSQGVSGINLDVSKLPAGLYFINVFDQLNGNIENKQFIKN